MIKPEAVHHGGTDFGSITLYDQRQFLGKISAIIFAMTVAVAGAIHSV